MFEDLSVADHDRIAGVLRLLSPLNSTNLGAGLGQAYAVAERAKAPPTRHRVILLTDGLFELDRSTVYRIEHLLSEAAAEGIHFDVIDLAQEEGPQVGSVLPRFAQAGGGTFHRAVNVQQVHWGFSSLDGRVRDCVAREVRLRVVFNPKAVAACRLLGHQRESSLG